jgi:hypothetical protein
MTKGNFSPKYTPEQMAKIAQQASNEMLAGKAPGQRGNSNLIRYPKGGEPTQNLDPNIEGLGKAAN